MRTQGFFKNLIFGSKRWKRGSSFPYIFKDSSQITPLIWWFSEQPSWWELFLTVTFLVSTIHMHLAFTVLWQEFHLCEAQVEDKLPQGRNHISYVVWVHTELRKVQSTSVQMWTGFLGNLCPSLKHTEQITPVSPMLSVSPPLLHHFDPPPWFTIIFLLRQLPVWRLNSGSWTLTL